MPSPPATALPSSEDDDADFDAASEDSSVLEERGASSFLPSGSTVTICSCTACAARAARCATKLCFASCQAWGARLGLEGLPGLDLGARCELGVPGLDLAFVSGEVFSTMLAKRAWPEEAALPGCCCGLGAASGACACCCCSLGASAISVGAGALCTGVAAGALGASGAICAGVAAGALSVIAAGA